MAKTKRGTGRVNRTITINEPQPTVSLTSKDDKPYPLRSVVASANRIVKQDLGAYRTNSKVLAGDDREWQLQSWDMYDLVGEQHFLTNILAGKGAQARLYIGHIDVENLTAAPTESEQTNLNAILNTLGGGPLGREQFIKRLYLNLYITGEAFPVGIPPHTVDSNGLMVVPSSYALNDVEWYVLSVDEVSRKDDMVVLKLPEHDKDVTCNPDEIFFLRSWNPHPRWAARADCPAKASLPALSELVDLTMYIASQAKSRLAGAGVLVVPQSAVTKAPAGAGLNPNQDDDDFVESLMLTMLTPLSDPGNASSVVPLVVEIPDEAVGKLQHLEFSTPLDSQAPGLRDQAIRRLALAQDAPPELLLGTSGLNHWGSWLVKEETISTHIEPYLALICDALTTQFLWPLLEESLGMTPEEAQEHVIWYDVAHLRTKPNVVSDALELHARGVLSDTALRTVTGFGDEDGHELTLPESIALRMVRNQPELLESPGFGALLGIMESIYAGKGSEVGSVAVAAGTGSSTGEDRSVDAGESSEGTGERLIPNTDGNDAEPPSMGSEENA